MKRIIKNTIMSLLIVLSLLFVVSCTDSNNNNQKNENNSGIIENIDMESKVINVYLIGGQSNAVGYGIDTGNAISNSDSRFVNGFENVLYYGNQYRESGDEFNLEFKPLEIGYGKGIGMSGAEIGIASAIADEGEMNAIIKCAWGATHLYPDTNYYISLEQGTWTPPSYIEKHNPDLEKYPLIGRMYRWFEETVSNGIKLLIEDGYTPIIKGMWWMQGEAEMGGKTMSDAYEELLRTLIKDVRNSVTEITGYDCSDMPFVFGLPSWNTKVSGAPLYEESVRNQMSRVANDKSLVNVGCVDTRGLTQHDGWHFDGASQKYLGENFIAELQKLNEGQNSKFEEKISQNDINLAAAEKGLKLSANLSSHILDNNYEYGFIVVPTNELTENNIKGNYIELLEEKSIEYKDIPCNAKGKEIEDCYNIFINGTYNIDYINFNTSYTTIAYILDENGEYLYSAAKATSLSQLASKELYTSSNDTQKIEEIANAGVNLLFNVPEGNAYQTSDLKLEVPTNINLTNSQSAKPTKLEVKQQPNIGYYVNYSSSDESIVSVDETGNLITHKAGNAVISVMCGGKTETINVSVTNKNIDGVVYDGVMSNDEYKGNAITKSNSRTTAKISGMVKNKNIHLSLVITHDSWSAPSNMWFWNDNIEFYIDGVKNIVEFVNGVVKFPSAVSHGVVSTISSNGKLVTTVEMMLEGNKDKYKLKLGMNGKQFDWLGALWDTADQPDITTEGLTSPTLIMDGNFTESVWNNVNKNNSINVTANGANVNIVGTIVDGGVLFGVTIKHKKDPNVSTNGGTNYYNYMNVEFQFNNGGTQFIYTVKGVQSNNSFLAGHKSVKNGDTYTTTMEYFIPFTSIGVSNSTTSINFTCSGWVESGWCWFFPENQSWTATHKISSNGIVKK